MLASKNLSENIADKIKNRIITGEYAVNEQLPSEQELASMSAELQSGKQSSFWLPDTYWKSSAGKELL